jgi:citrate synthase
MLSEAATPEQLQSSASRIAREHQSGGHALPGFGHPTHHPDDPRAARLLDLARDRSIAGRHVEALTALSGAVDHTFGKHITVNVTGAVAAVLGDCGAPCEILRGFALVARCAGLVGHIHEEQKKPALRALWEAAEGAVPYEPPSD